MQALTLTSTTEAGHSDLNLSAIAARVRRVMELTGRDGKQFAAAAGVPYGTMRAYLGGRSPSAEFLAGAYRAFGVSPVYLLTGHGEPFVNQESSGHPSGFVSVPYLPSPSRLAPSAAPGQAVAEAEQSYEAAGFSLSRDWIARKQLDTETLAVTRVRGRAMEKVLWDGDTVLVDTADTQCETGFVYVLRQGNELLARFCQLLPGGMLRVSSENPSFTAYDVDLTKTEDVQVVGRVVAAMHEF